MLVVVVIILILMGTGVIKGNREPLGAGMRIAFGDYPSESEYGDTPKSF